jgi:threonine aldolase
VVLAAVVAANEGRTASYGNDPWTARAVGLLCERLGAVAAAPVLTGTAANVLSLELVLHPYEAVICARTAHIEVDECGAPERYLGCKLQLVDVADGKLTPELVAAHVRDVGDPHRVQAGAVSISQPTELGTLYTPDELRALARTARTHGLALHVDGARLPMAAAALGCSLAEAAGAPDVDVLSFGGTKCGALGAEAIVVYREGLADSLAFQRKQAMQLASKLRFVGAQLAALLEDDLWRELASTANTLARRLADGLAEHGVEIALPVETNAVFARLAQPARDELAQAYAFGVWEDGLARFMAAWDSTPASIDAFVAEVGRASAATGDEG